MCIFLNHHNLTVFRLWQIRIFFFDSVHTLCGASCPWGYFPWSELSIELVVHGASFPWGELSKGWAVHWASCPRGKLSMGRAVFGVSCPWGKLSWGELSWGEFRWGEFVWGEFRWGELTGNCPAFLSAVSCLLDCSIFLPSRSILPSFLQYPAFLPPIICPFSCSILPSSCTVLSGFPHSSVLPIFLRHSPFFH